MIAAAIGSPINVLTSDFSSALPKSPIMLRTKIIIAARVPQSAPRHRPTAAKQQAVPTMSMIAVDQLPIDWNAACASGLRRQRASSAVPRKQSNPTVTMHMLTPKAKNDASQG